MCNKVTHTEFVPMDDLKRKLRSCEDSMDQLIDRSKIDKDDAQSLHDKRRGKLFLLLLKMCCRCIWNGYIIYIIDFL